MINCKSHLYKSAVNRYRTKFANDAAMALDPSYFGPIDTTSSSSSSSTSRTTAPLSITEPWYKVKWSDPWAFAGAVGMALPGLQAGYSLSNGLIRKLDIDNDSLKAKLIRLLGSSAGLVGGAYLGRYAMLPFNAAAPLGKWVTNKLKSSTAGTVASVGTLFGGSMLYTALADKLLNAGKRLGLSMYANAPPTHNDAVAAIDKELKKDPRYSYLLDI